MSYKQGRGGKGAANKNNRFLLFLGGSCLWSGAGVASRFETDIFSDFLFLAFPSRRKRELII